MKILVALCVVSILTLAYGKPNPSECVYDPWGKCLHQCEEGTYSYNTGCGPLTPQATCEDPNPVADTRSAVCDYSACYCNAPTVRDTVSEKCVKLAECPKKEKEE